MAIKYLDIYGVFVNMASWTLIVVSIITIVVCIITIINIIRAARHDYKCGYKFSKKTIIRAIFTIIKLLFYIGLLIFGIIYMYNFWIDYNSLGEWASI